MSFELAFQLVNAVALPWWALWILAPRSAWAARAASQAGIFLALAGLYAAGFVAMGVTAETGGLDFMGLRRTLASPLGFLVGWTHYVMLDLFAGAWIVREARRLDLGPRAYLLGTMLVAPIGLGAFLARRTLRLRSFGQIGESDLV